jgi:hypothetical protein
MLCAEPGGVLMSSVLAETVDVVIEKSRGRLGEISVEDVVTGFFTEAKPKERPLPTFVLHL